MTAMETKLIEALASRGVHLAFRAGKWVGACPVHHGKDSNFRLWVGRDGKLRARCHSQCATTWSPAGLLCVLDGHEPRGAAYRNAMVELGLADADNGGTMPPAPPTHWPSGEPMPVESALTEAIAAWLGYSAGDFAASSPSDPTEAALPTPGSFVLVAPTWDHRMVPLAMPRKLAVVRYLQMMVGAPPLLLLVATEDDELHALFARSGKGRDKAFGHAACRLGADPRLLEMPELAINPRSEIPHAVAFHYDREVPA